MDTKVNYTIIGAFVIILFSFMVLAIIWLSAGFSTQTYTTYKVDMQEAVTGLSNDATVEFNGVSVGNVDSIKINKNDPKSVELLLSIQSDTPISRGTFATLSTRGVTGITYISLKDKGDDPRPLKAIGNQPYPIIKTGPSIFLQLDTALQKLTDSVKQVSESIKALLDKDNLLSIKQILANTSQITGTIAMNNQKLTAILINTQRASAKLPLLIQNSTQTMSAIQSQLLPDANHAIANFNNMSENLSALSAELRENPSILIRGKEPPPLGPGEK